MNTKNEFVGFDVLKQAVSIGQILDRYGLTAQLHRSGDSLSGACPLHQGHNPTQFRVSLSKNCWICFGDCHQGGSIIDFVSRKEGVGVREAALLIQDWFHVQPNGRNGGNGSAPHERKSVPAVQPGSPLPPYRTFNPPLRLTLGPLDGTHPYLQARGLTPETIQTFGLGGCPHGLLRGWIAIPIHNARGDLIAYAGRWPGEPPEGQPKYRLPRGFRKSLELFNQHRALQADRAEPLVVVEGFFGCMKVWQAGHRRVVSLMGSMLSPAQEERLVQLAGPQGRILLLFDEDGAGSKGRAEAQQRLRRQVRVKALRLPERRQPDSLPAEDLLRLIHKHAREEVPA